MEKLNMIEMNIKNKLIEIFVNELEFDRSTDFDQLDINSNNYKWDSVNHLDLMMAIEEEFNIKISFAEMENLYQFQAIIDFISSNILVCALVLVYLNS